METPDVTSQEKLDRMLREGTISKEDYKRLSSAMRTVPKATEDEALKPPTTPRRLCKSWSKRQLGGVCAGLADHLGIDPVIVRVIAVIAAFAALPATEIVYLFMYFYLPWDDKEAALEPQRKGRPWRFAFWLTFLFTIVPFLIDAWVVPRFVNVFQDLGAALPLVTRLAITAADSYRHLGVPLSLFLVGSAAAFYLICHKPRLRAAFAILMTLLGIAWSLLLFLGMYVGLLNLPKHVH
jgi:phage shock protein C